VPVAQDSAHISARFRFLDAFTTFIRDAANESVLVLILEDLHWADNSSLVLLEFLSHHIGNIKLFIIGTYRDVELSREHPLRQTLGDLSREEFFERIPLSGLSQAEVERFVTRVQAVSDIEGISGDVYERTEGNPLFMHEMVRMFIDEGNAASGQAKSRLQAKLSVPDGVREVIQRRLFHLSDACNETLSTASVVGQEFDSSLLLTLLAPMPERELLEALEEARVAMLLEENKNIYGRYRFNHALTQETLLSEISMARRFEIHARIVEALEERYGETADDHAVEFVEHCAAAKSVVGEEKLLHYLVASCERSLESCSWESALGYYERCFEIKNESSCDAVSARLHAGRAFAQYAMCLYQEANSSYRKAFECYEVLGDIDGMVSVVTSPIRFFREDEWLERACTVVVKRVRKGTAQYGSVQSNLSHFAFFRTGDYDTARSELQSVIDDAVARSDSATEMRALAHLGEVARESHHFEETVIAARRALEIARDLGDVDTELQMLLSLMNAYKRLGDRLECVYLELFRVLAEKVGGRHNRFAAYLFSASFAIQRADLESAYEYQSKVMAIREPTSYEWMIMASIERERGNLNEHARCMEHACGLLSRDKVNPTHISHLVRASYLTGDDRWSGIAKQHASDALEIARETEQAKMYVATARAWLFVASGGKAAATNLRDEMKISDSSLRALVMRTHGDMESAIRNLRDGIEDLRSRDHRLNENWATYWLAETLLDRGDPGDEENARTIAREVIENTEQVGMVFLREKTEQLLRRIPGGGAAYPGGLTEREVDVMRLVAEGLTNNGIGDKLFISPKTVGTHMKHIFAKIGVSNRTEASAYAIRNGLISE
jgi:DNA-binding NarL/FixJ family response regulator